MLVLPLKFSWLLGGRFGRVFDDDPKQWRMYAELIGSFGRLAKSWEVIEEVISMLLSLILSPSSAFLSS
jgi:hypothetical protein